MDDGGDLPLFVPDTSQMLPPGTVAVPVELQKGTAHFGGTFRIGVKFPNLRPGTENSYLPPIYTDGIPYDATPTVMNSALMQIPNVGLSIIRRIGPNEEDLSVWKIEMANLIGNIPNFVIDSSNLTGSNATMRIDELQSGNSIGGSFDLKWPSGGNNPDTFVIQDIPVNASAAEFKSLLLSSAYKYSTNHISQHAFGNIDVTRHGPDKVGGYSWEITFVSNIGNEPELQLLDIYNLTGLDANVNITTISNGNSVGGNFSLEFGRDITTPLAYNSSAYEIRSALNKLRSIGAVTVVKDFNYDKSGGYSWNVTFVEYGYNSGDLELISHITPHNNGAALNKISRLTGIGATVDITEISKGATAKNIARWHPTAAWSNHGQKWYVRKSYGSQFFTLNKG